MEHFTVLVLKAASGVRGLKKLVSEFVNDSN